MFSGRSSSPEGPDVPTRSGARSCHDPRRMSTSSHEESSRQPIAAPSSHPHGLYHPQVQPSTLDFRPERINHLGFHPQMQAGFMQGGFVQMMNGVNQNVPYAWAGPFPQEYAGQTFGIDTSAVVHQNPAGRSSGGQAQLDNRPPENESNRTDRYSGASVDKPFDPPSGNNLIHRKAPRQQIVYESYQSTPENEAVPIEERRGRKQGKISPIVYEYEKKPFVSKAANEDKFNLAEANADVGAALRIYYAGDKRWDDVCVAIRNKMWRDFRMRYRWRPEDELLIAELWDKLCRQMFRQMMYQAHKIYQDGLLNDKLCRAKWMQPPMFNIARLRWDSEAEKEESKKKAKNRGVCFGDDGKVVKEAPPTQFSGPVSTMEYALQIELEGSNTTKFKKPKVLPVESNDGLPKTYAEAFRRSKVGNIKEVLESQSRIENGTNEREDEDGQGAVVPVVQEKWVDTQSRDLYTNYTEKAIENSESASGIVGNFNPTLWAECAGGYSHGRMRGVPKGALIETGFMQSRGRALPPVPHQDFSGDDESRKRAALMELELKETKLELAKQKVESKKAYESFANVLNVMKQLATANCTPAEIFKQITIPTFDDVNVDDAVEQQDDGDDESADES